MMTRLTKSSYMKIVLVCLLCLTICGTLVGGFGCVRNFADSWRSPWDNYKGSWMNDSTVATGSFEIGASDVNDLAISWLAGKVDVKVVGDSETRGNIIIQESDSAKPPLRWRQTNGKLEIDYGNVQGLLGCSQLSFSSKDLTVLVPKSRADKFDSIELDAASGEYKLDGLGCKRFVLDQASGNVRFANFDAENFTLNLASGAVVYEGEIHGALNSDQASGSAVFDLKLNDPRSAALSLASGEMKLMLPKPGFSVALDKMSGNFSSDYELFSNGNVFYSKADGEGIDALAADDAATKISMNMMSGNFVIGKS